jgi:hypothetical protein
MVEENDIINANQRDQRISFLETLRNKNDDA